MNIVQSVNVNWTACFLSCIVTIFQCVSNGLQSRQTISRKNLPHTDKKENQIFLIYKEIQSGAVAKSYVTNGLLVYREIFTHFLIY